MKTDATHIRYSAHECIPFRNGHYHPNRRCSARQRWQSRISAPAISTWAIALENDALRVLRDAGRDVFIHVIITGGQALFAMGYCPHFDRHRGHVCANEGAWIQSSQRLSRLK